MSSRDKILATIKANQPSIVELPDVNIPQSDENLVERYKATARSTGAEVFEVVSMEEVRTELFRRFKRNVRIISSYSELSDVAETDVLLYKPHDLQDVEVAVLKADIGVAENAALWVPENNAMKRILPFIAQHLVLVIAQSAIVPTLHQAYEMIGESDYGYSAFIAGPSKTADIEQSLVLGAHGPRSLTVFVLMNS
jgi:L-lactate dehydrogenase complex protein LldG